MEADIFDISFEEDGMQHKGWVNPSDKLTETGEPVSYHVVLNDTSFGYLSFNNCKWTVNEQRPEKLVRKIGKAIEQHYQL